VSLEDSLKYGIPSKSLMRVMATMITKMELVEGELGRFAMKRGEEPTQTYNRLKTLVNKIRSYGSIRWMEHDVVRLMLKSFTVIDPHLVNLIR
jgi:hypothetical protein